MGVDKFLWLCYNSSVEENKVKSISIFDKVVDMIFFFGRRNGNAPKRLGQKVFRDLSAVAEVDARKPGLPGGDTRRQR